MRSPDTLNQVAEFHRVFQQPILPMPKIPNIDRCNLRISLLVEELEELREAITEGDLVAVSDALCDLQYVLTGTVLEFGLGDLFKHLFEEVHRSNMSKSCDTVYEANLTIDSYRQKGTHSSYVPLGGKYLVRRDGDGKILKSISYSPAELETTLLPHLSVQPKT